MEKKLMRKGLIVIIIFLFIIAGIIPSSEQKILEKLSQSVSKGDTLHVGGSGPSNYTKIQDAIDDSQPGDTIYVYDYSSPYYENVFIYKSINLIGEDTTNTVIDGKGIDDPLWVNTSFVNIRGFSIINSSINDYGQGICLVDKKWHNPDEPYVTLTNINISDCIIKDNGGCGIRLDNTMNVNVCNCTIESNLATSVYILNSRHVNLYQCEIYNNGEDLANESETPGGICIRNNPTLGNSENIEIYNCNIQNNIDCGVGINSGCSNIKIYNNTIIQNTRQGIFVSSSSGPIEDIFIEHNVLLSNGHGDIYDAGISLQDHMDNVSIINNNISYNNRSGIYSLRSTGITIFNNCIFKNYLCGLQFIPSTEYPDNNVVYHNNVIKNFWNAIGAGNSSWDNGYPSGGNYWDDYGGADNYLGPAQNISGSDGIGDTPYNIFGGSRQDHFPLMFSYGMINLTLKFVPRPFHSLISIKNGGSATALNVQWLLMIKGGILICKREYSEIVKPLLPGEEITLSPRFFLIGLGHIEIQISSWADNAPVVSTKITGFLLLFFFFNR